MKGSYDLILNIVHVMENVLHQNEFPYRHRIEHEDSLPVTELILRTFTYYERHQ